MAIASASGRFADYMTEVGRNVGLAQRAPTMGADLMVASERGLVGAAVCVIAITPARRNCASAYAASDPHLRVEWVAGQLSARTLATTRLAETWIHTGDVAEALDVELAPRPAAPHRPPGVAHAPVRVLRAGRELYGPGGARAASGRTASRGTFTPTTLCATTIAGDGVELCLVAARRVDPVMTSLTGEGPDVDAVLELVRTYA